MTQGNSSITIQLNNVSKKFGSNWIFKDISACFESGKKYAVTGPNGSGKSTLLKIIAGIVTPNIGEVKFGADNRELALDDVFREISFCAPYMELPEEMNMTELLTFHQNLRQLTISAQQLIDIVQVEPDKEIRNYSSGMKQRLKLALAFYTQSKVLLLDEPTSNLDQHWSDWYLDTVQKTSAGRLVVISSNYLPEYSFCDEVMDIHAAK